MRSISIPLVHAASVVSSAQDLIPNGSFEQVLLCPDFQSQLDRTAFWFDPSEMGTPDYYHACAANAWFETPQSTVGFQEPVDGEAYAGIFLWMGWAATEEVREYLEVELTEALVENRCYRFRLRVNLADFSGFTTDAFGMRFYTDSVLLPTVWPPGDEPHIALAPGNFLTREDWTVLDGEYIATGGERFVMIGNYLFDAETTTQELTGGPPNVGDMAYALVDSVSLTTCLTTGQTEATPTSRTPGLVLRDGMLHWTGPIESSSAYCAYDVLGRVLAKGPVTQLPVALPVGHRGMLIVEYSRANGRNVLRLLVE